MGLFLDVRLAAVGGDLATSVAINERTAAGVYQSATLLQLQQAVQGRHVLLATHGFNVNRANGIGHLSNWNSLLHLLPPAVFVGMLWPGDSVWAHGLNYPEEPRVANDAGALLGPFIDRGLAGAATVSFASHSLGARVVLQTIAHMTRPVRRLILMAGAIDDDCLTSEFADAAKSVGEISVLASRKDEVLALAFPLGNFLGGILTSGHPWWHGALGRTGPVAAPLNFQPPFEIPNNWAYGHGDYLHIDPPPAPQVPMPTIVPPDGTQPPAQGAAGWKEAWSAAFASTRFE